MKKFLLILLLIFVLGALSASFWFWDSAPPQAQLTSNKVVGKDSVVRIECRDAGKGLRHVRVQLIQGDKVETLAEESFPLTRYPWDISAKERTIELKSWSERGLQDGEFTISVRLEDEPNLWLFGRTTQEDFKLRFDSRPPGVEALSRQHYLRQGGSEAILYRVTEADCRSGVRVGDQEFVGYPVPGQPAGTYLCLFALGFDQSPDSPILLWAEDAAGNRTESHFSCKTFAQTFRRRRIEISDQFISSVAPGILSHTDKIKAGSSPLETFLAINRDLRKINNEQIARLTRQLSPRLYWSDPFLQLSNSKVESVFADQRSYFYQGKKCDEQVHLGFDLASLAHSKVEASNAGKVVYADDLGIYGNAVIIDHGFGLFSLYGHLSSLSVKEGQIVLRGQTLGNTGQTGLAGGDHLHFSMLVQGVQVNPIEWWDPAWVKMHVLAKLAGTTGE